MKKINLPILLIVGLAACQIDGASISDPETVETTLVERNAKTAASPLSLSPNTPPQDPLSRG